MTEEEISNLLGSYSKKPLSLNIPQEQLDKLPETVTRETIDYNAESPLSFGQRLKIGFGNQKGIIKFLKSQGLNPVYKDGTLYIKKGNKLIAADPSAFSDLSTFVTDFGGDVADFASESPGIAAQTAALASTVNPIARILMSAIGSGIGERGRSAIGEVLGTYENEQHSLITPEVPWAALVGASAEVLPVLYRGSKSGIKSLLSKMGEKNIPERLYAQGTGIPLKKKGMMDVVKKLMGMKAIGGFDTLEDIAAQGLEGAESKLQAELAKSPSKVTIGDISKAIENYLPEVDVMEKDALVEEKKKLIKLLGALSGEEGFEPKVLNQEKRNLYKSVGKLFGTDTATTTTKTMKKAAASAIRESLENKAPDPKLVSQINKDINAYFQLGKAIDLQKRKIEGKSLITGVDAVVGGVGGIKAVLIKKLAQAAAENPAILTNVSYILNKAVQNGKNISTDPTTLQNIFSIIQGTAGRDYVTTEE